jgi:hypothetical protein
MSEDLTKKLPASESEKILSILKAIDTRLKTLEQTVAERLHDTRPIWQKLVTNVGELRSEVTKIRTSQRDVLRRISVVNDTLLGIQADYRDIYDRIEGLETNHNAPNSST